MWEFHVVVTAFFPFLLYFHAAFQANVGYMLNINSRLGGLMHLMFCEASCCACVFICLRPFLKLVSSWCRALGAEHDDLNAKSRDAEKDVNVLQMKIQELNDSLSKHRKDLECMYFYPLFHLC